MNDLKRYQAQINLREVGLKGQTKLRSSAVLVVGAGGLGCPALMNLCASGVGTIGIVDNDTVDLSNLHRQPLYTEENVGQNKVLAASDRLNKMNSEIIINQHVLRLTAENAQELLPNYDVVIDCSDNLQTRYVIDDVCKTHSIPMIFAGIHKHQGQLAVFNFKENRSYSSVFPAASSVQSDFSCAQDGVLSTLTTMLGSMQANEAIKIICGFGDILCDGMMIIDLKSNRFEKMRFQISNDNPKIKYKPKTNSLMEDPKAKTISAEEFASRLLKGFDGEVIDVREKHEVNEFSELESKNIPLDQLEERLSELDLKVPHVLVCQTGARSRIAAERIKIFDPEAEIYNLDGGMNAMKDKA